jgi:hypothetical protein
MNPAPSNNGSQDKLNIDVHFSFFILLHLFVNNKVLAHRTSLTPPLLIEVPVPNQESKQ